MLWKGKENLSPSILKKWFTLSTEVVDRGENGGDFEALLRQKLIFLKYFGNRHILHFPPKVDFC